MNDTTNSTNTTIMEYKGYIGSIEYSEPDQVFHGKVQGIRSSLSYEGTNLQELLEDFHGVVDDYLEICAEDGRQPEVAYQSSFSVNFSGDLYKKASIYALKNKQSLNSFVEDAVKSKLQTLQTV